jgi:TRAP-type C4-dicarboxylate transport system permease small subunit
MTGERVETQETAAVRGVEGEMRTMAIVILAAGILALAYGGFSYTKETHDANLGPLKISVSEKERVNVPLWAGVALAVVGAGLLVAAKK